MDKKEFCDRLAAGVVSILLILAAWGNATALLVFSILGILLGVIFFRKQLAQGGLLAAMVGFVISIVIAFTILKS
jgi:hypothetical protein